MQRSITCAFAAVAAAAALGVTGAATPGWAAGPAQTARASAMSYPAGIPGALLWVSRYTTAGKLFDVGRAVAFSPRGDRVYVTGYSEGKHTATLKYVDYATIAYNAATGAQLWVSRYNGRANGADEAQSVAVSPSGRTVFVTGYSVGAHSEQDYATIAYNAATGARVWIKRYNGPGGNYDAANSVTVSHNGRTVFVTGLSAGVSTGFDYATIAYNAVTGARRWVDRYNGPANGYDEARSIAAARHGAKVFLTGYSEGAGSGSDFATVAYNSVTGDRLWVRRYNGPGNESDEASQVAVGPDGRKIFVARASASAASLDYATVAYDALTGSRRVKRYDGPGNDLDGANSVAVSPDGRRVFVTGDSIGSGSSFDYATIAYWARSGDPLWVKRYNGPGNGIDAARSVLISPDGRIAFITGGSDGIASGRDYATVAYDAVTGHRLLVRRYNGPGDNWDTAFSMAISPAGWTIVVTGESVGRTTHFDYATVAYRA